MLQNLEFVLALAREKHFGRAADICGVTQPTLSAGLKALEHDLGVLIVRRSSRFQGFTPEGERVLEWARRIVGDARALRQDLDALKHGLEGHLRLAVIPTALPLAARLTGPFRDKYPAVRFTVLSTSSTEILTLLANFEIDAGISYLDNEPLGEVRTVPLHEERYSLLTARGGPLAERACVSWAEVGRLPLCLLTPDMQNRRIMDEMFSRSGVDIALTLESNSPIVLMSHVGTGRWSSVLPPLLADSIALPQSVVVIPIVAPDVVHMVGLVVADRTPMTPLVSALVAEARALRTGLAATNVR